LRANRSSNPGRAEWLLGDRAALVYVEGKAMAAIAWSPMVVVVRV
jgi:hypothetical protein